MRMLVDKEAIYAARSDLREDYGPSRITSLQCNYWERRKSPYSGGPVAPTHLADRAAQGFTTATELADTLVRKAGLTYHQAHQVASGVVHEALSAGRKPHEIRAVHLDAADAAILGRPIG